MEKPKIFDSEAFQIDEQLLQDLVAVTREHGFTEENIISIENALSKGFPSHHDWISIYGAAFVEMVHNTPGLSRQYTEDPETCLEEMQAKLQEAVKSTLN